MTRRTRSIRVAGAAAVAERRADGTVRLRSPHTLGAYPAKFTERLDYWADRAPERTLFARRAGAAWKRLSYREARDRAKRIAAGLLARGLSPERPLAVLSGNDLEHALLLLAALYAGVPYAPVSPAYSLVSSDFAQLKHVMALVTPGLVYAADEGAFGRAVSAAVPRDAQVLCATDFHGLEREDTEAAERAHARVGPDTIAKFLFTSGSTGTPKAVINTQRMWCSNQAMVREVLSFVQDEPPVMVDWAPWHHTAGGNKDLGMVLYNGGTMYIDEGKPLPGAIETTVRNLREVAPNWYFTVPKGYEMLLPFLRDDAALRRNFMSRLKAFWFAGAGVSQHVFDEYRELSYRTCGEQILFLTGLGSTETAPFTIARTWDSGDATNMGLPPPGVDMKLVPVQENEDGKYEARVKGPHITPGYWRQPELTREAFDEEGYYRLGDAFAFEDDDPAKGLLFRGRISEDFKLSSGTWVNVGPLRAKCIGHFAPLVRDVVITGHERDELGALVFPSGKVDRAELLARLRSMESTGSSNRIARMLVLDEPPSLDAGEMTDKGSINQRAVLSRRAALVQELYAGSPRVMTA
ncbi:MAG TPA: feruloyl-CoA synthase [Burkholderiales bacterium]|nr:feruloyl-CoA synthase [Burkholderiales bacterium]